VLPSKVTGRVTGTALTWPVALLAVAAAAIAATTAAAAIGSGEAQASCYQALLSPATSAPNKIIERFAISITIQWSV